MRIALATALALLPIAATARSAPPTPAYVAVGRAIDSVQVYNVDQILPLGPRALLFKMRTRPDYRSDLASDCRYNPDNDIIIHRTPTTSYTSGEVLELQDRYQHFFTGACIIGPLTPVKPVQP